MTAGPPIVARAVRLLGLLPLLAAACAAGPTVVVVEEHMLAPVAWERARAAGALPPRALLVHLDAHEDLGVPEAEGPDVELSPADVVVPAVRSGVIGAVLWVPPPWLTVEPRPGTLRAGPGGPEFAYRVARLGDLPEAPGPYILDVDLDFFACENPHALHLDREITRAEYDAALAAGTARMRGEAREEDVITESVVLSRPPGPFTWPVRLDRVRDVHTGRERYVCGCVCMGEYRDAFPVHRPSDAEVDALVAEVRAALGRLRVRPVLITVSRSAQSGFTPADRAAGLERRLLAALRDLWPAPP